MARDFGKIKRPWLWAWTLALVMVLGPIVVYRLYGADLRREIVVPPSVESTVVEQWAAVISSFTIKPVYMLLSLLLIFLLRKKREVDLSALKWGIVAFFAGEASCTVNYLLGGLALPIDYLHAAGMAASFGLITYALMEGIDRRVLRFTVEGRGCALGEVCGSCAKTHDVPCGLRRVFLMLVPAAVFMCLLPFCARTSTEAYNTVVLGTPYVFYHPPVLQLFEIRFCPAYALAAGALSFLVLLIGGHRGMAASKILFSAALGPLLFGIFRLALTHTFGDNLIWPAFWEEATELLFIAGVLWVLYTFRRTLLNRT